MANGYSSMMRDASLPMNQAKPERMDRLGDAEGPMGGNQLGSGSPFSLPRPRYNRNRQMQGGGLPGKVGHNGFGSPDYGGARTAPLGPTSPNPNDLMRSFGHRQMPGPYGNGMLAGGAPPGGRPFSYGGGFPGGAPGGALAGAFTGGSRSYDGGPTFGAPGGGQPWNAGALGMGQVPGQGSPRQGGAYAGAPASWQPDIHRIPGGMSPPPQMGGNMLPGGNINELPRSAPSTLRTGGDPGFMTGGMGGEQGMPPWIGGALGGGRGPMGGQFGGK